MSPPDPLAGLPGGYFLSNGLLLMAYVIATWKDKTPYGVTADKSSNSFQLIPLVSDMALGQIFSSPYLSGAQSILKWINANDPVLSCEELQICDEARFRK